MKIKNYLLLIFLIIFSTQNIARTEIVEKIIVEGNQRISSETINIFTSISINENLDSNKINQILKEIYETGFFQDVKVQFNNGILKIVVIENPIVQNIIYEGIKSQTMLETIKKDLKLKERSSFNETLLLADKKKIINSLKNLGYFFSKVDILKEDLGDKKINLTYQINLGNKAKIKKISFLGNKIFKNNRLKRLIISEEYKFWKFISGKKYLNEDLTKLDTRLLKNYYLNNGYYNVAINTSFAKLINDDAFELIFNIDAGEKIHFNKISLDLSDNFNKENFNNLESYFIDIKGQPYSLYTIQKIIDQIEEITLNEEYQSINASFKEEIINNNINIVFKIEESEDFYVEKINIYGNSVTKESVIRNKFYLDEGDPYNEILKNKTLNQIKSLNFFKSVEVDVSNGEEKNSKIIDISVEEKATGEISATAGISSAENTIGFAVKENNFMGNGVSLDSNLTLSTDSIKGLLSVKNPNFLNTDKSISLTLEATELDKFTDFGYKTSKTGFSYSTNFEYLDDFWLGIGNSNYYQNIETDHTASAAQKKQRGDYFDSYLKLDFDYDKRNQKYQTSSGFRSYYSLDLPLISDTFSLINTYNYSYFTQLYENNISSFSIYLNAVNSIKNKDVKLSERSYIPSNKLRGFKFGSVGPKDGSDYIGGNYISTLNFMSTLPKLLENSQNTDFSLFIDIANIWGVDYSSEINDSNEIRSSIGIALDWLTPLGPLNFSLSQPITKANTDEVETFRFNLGTTF